MRRTRNCFLSAAAALALTACATQAPVETQSSQQDAVGGGLRAAAQASQQAQNYAGAVAYYSSLYERNPEDLPAVLGLARSSRYAGDTSRAINVTERALVGHPDHPELMAEYGKALLAANRPKDAVPVLLRAGDLAPQDASVRSALGIAHDMLDERTNAIAAYESALAIAPDDPVTLNNIGLSRALDGDLQGAVAALRRAVQQPHATAQMRQNLALLLAAGGDLVEAERLVRADLQVELADANMSYLRGLAAASKTNNDPTAALPAMPIEPPLPKLTVLPAAETVSSEPVAAAEPIAVPEAAPEPTAEPVADATGTAAAEATAEAAASDTAASEAAGSEAGGSETGAATDFSSAAAEAADEAFAAIMGAEGAEGQGAAQPTYRLQLASYLSPSDAANGRTQLDRELHDVLGGLDIVIIAATLADGSKVYRLMAGPLVDKDEAISMCRAIEQRKIACIVQPAGA